MTDRLTLSLWEEGQAHKAISFLWKNAKEAIAQGFVEGKTTDQIIRELRGTRAKGYIDGLIQKDRRDIEAVGCPRSRASRRCSGEGRWTQPWTLSRKSLRPKQRGRHSEPSEVRNEDH